MNPIIKPETINILGGPQDVGSCSNETAHSASCQRQTVLGKIKCRIRKVWTGILNVAEDIKEKIIPAIVPTIKAIAEILTAVAVFHNSGCRYDQKKGAKCPV